MKLHTIITFLLVSLIAYSPIYAQWGSEDIKGNKEVMEESRSILGFEEIAIAGAFEVELVKEDSDRILIIAESNLLKYILTHVENGKLSIETPKKINLKPTEKILIRIPFTEITEIEKSGSGKITSESEIKTKNLDINCSGSSKVNLVVDVSNDLSISKSGSCHMQIEGFAENLDIKSSGSGKFESEKLSVKEADVKLSGSGEIHLSCEDELNVKVSGSGKVLYAGDPSNIDIKTSGSGKVERL